jgi:Tol biopolymer transport system component/DNA-binding winged helix-turn-helix (wHTH) protein
VAEVVRFGVFEANRTTGELRKGGLRIRLQDQPFQILLMLLERPGEVVTREEIQLRLWPEGTFVEFEHSIGTAIKKLRQALGDDADTPRYIETLPRRGFRFIGPVESSAAESFPPRSETGSEAVQESASDSAIVASIVKRHKKAAIGSVAVVAALVVGTWFLLHRPPKSSAELRQKRLTFNTSENPVQGAALSPDGKYLAYSDVSGIHVKLLSTGEERHIPRPTGVPAGTYWGLDSWFPDGTQLLAEAWEPGGHKSLWTVSVVGQSPRELREGAAGFEVSPDGKHIAFRPIGTSDYAQEIWVMGIQGDNAQRVLAVGENEWVQWAHWSPDGQRLVYVRVHGAPGKIQRSMETCDLKGARRTVVVPDTDQFLSDFCWLAEGRIVYALNEPPDSSDGNLWQIRIDNHAGTPNGKPKRITQWAGSLIWGVSASADGKRLVLRKGADQAQVYLGELEAAGTRMKPPRRLTNDEAFDVPNAWTPDSKAVLFHSDRNGTWGIYKQGISQETAEAVVTGQQDASDQRLSADGAWILLVESPGATASPAPPERMMRIPVGGGVPQFVMEMQNWIDFSCARSPASLCLTFDTSPDQKKLMIAALDPLKGRGRVLRTIDNDPLHSYDHLTVSPDGSTLAISRDGEAEIHIRLLSTSGGPDREITVKGWPNLTGLDWSADGKGLYCGSLSAQGGTLLYVDLKGNARVLWQNKGSGAIWADPSPDGRYLAILGYVTNANVWMIEGF